MKLELEKITIDNFMKHFKDLKHINIFIRRVVQKFLFYYNKNIVNFFHICNRIKNLKHNHHVTIN